MYLLLDFIGYDETKLSKGALAGLENLVNLQLVNIWKIRDGRAIARVVQDQVSSDGKTEPKLLVAFFGELSEGQSMDLVKSIRNYLQMFRRDVPVVPVMVEKEPDKKPETPVKPAPKAKAKKAPK